MRGKLFTDIKSVNFGMVSRLESRRLGTTIADVVVADVSEDEPGSNTGPNQELVSLPMIYKPLEQILGLILVAASGQPRGFYTRWGCFVTSSGDFFRDEANEAPRDLYVEEEDGILVLV